MPSSAAQSAERKALAREAARRRQAVTELRVAASTAAYAADQLSNGLGPGEARRAALFAAGELAAVAGALRRAVRLSPAERRVLAVRLDALGMTRHQIGERIGVSERAVWTYLRPGSGHRGSPARSAGDCGPDDT